VIGELAATTAAEHRKASWIEQIGWLGRDAGCVERRVLKQPDQFARETVGDHAGARFHRRLGFGVGNEAARGRPARDGAVGA